ncbi:hypothetical protein [Paenibacillus xerothermodurans]|nr:hypothetical protein [Paenibacillus xerothermodurans]
MYSFAYYFQHYWLPVVLIVGVIAAGMLVYKNWNRIVMKGREKK